jgi:hypothetical protein
MAASTALYEGQWDRTFSPDGLPTWPTRPLVFACHNEIRDELKISYTRPTRGETCMCRTSKPAKTLACGEQLGTG